MREAPDIYSLQWPTSMSASIASKFNSSLLCCKVGSNVSHSSDPHSTDLSIVSIASGFS